MHAPESTNLTWRKSSYSNAQGECLEVARLGAMVGIRDSKNPTDGLLLLLPHANWRSFVTLVKNDLTDAQ